MTTLHAYQADLVERSRVAWGEPGVRSVLIASATGSGKGTIAVHVMRSAMSKGHRCVFIVHREELVADIGQRLVRAGVSDLCLHARGRSQGSPSAMVHVGLIQSFSSTGFRPSGVGLAIVDEAHHTVARTYRGFLASFPGVPVLGLTATPERGDRTALGDVFDRLVVGPSPKELTRLGVLAPCRVVRPPAFNGALAADPVGAYIRFASGRRGIVFAGRVPHAEELARAFADSGYPAASVDGKMDRALRKARLAGLARGELDLVTNVAVLTEGFDLPALECVVLASGSSSTGAYLQKAGRGLRACSGKRDLLLLDLWGDVHAYGFPDDDREWSLHGRAVRNVETLKPWTCKVCFTCLREPPGGACPHCGALPDPPKKPKRKDAELSEAHAVARYPEKWAKFQELVQIARIRNYDPRWIGLQFKQRFGHFPPFRLPKMKDGAHV